MNIFGKKQNESDRSLRTVVDQIYHIKVIFSIGDHKKFTGRLIDISQHGVCVSIKELIEEPKIEESGTLVLEKNGNVIQVPSSIRWIDPPNSVLRCVGLESKYNLIYTDLKNYIKL